MMHHGTPFEVFATTTLDLVQSLSNLDNGWGMPLFE